MARIKSSELEARLGEVLSRAARGEVIEVTREGAPFVRIVPANGQDRSRVADAARRLRAMRGMMQNTTVDELCDMRHEGHDR